MLKANHLNDMFWTLNIPKYQQADISDTIHVRTCLYYSGGNLPTP